eukprot:gene7000-9565_t
MSNTAVSPWSATMIGWNGPSNNNSKQKDVFVNESKDIIDYVKGVHHARKLSHMQVNYGETVKKLSNFQAEVPVQISNNSSTIKSTIQGTLNNNSALKLEQYHSKMNDDIKREKDINERKRMYNKEVGRVAVVNQILSGNAPISKDYIFPQKATHTQILAMTGKLKAPDASYVPPPMPKGKKWLGEGIGWST